MQTPHINDSVVPTSSTLYRSEYEKDACGVGFVAHIKGDKQHKIIRDGLKILENLDHRGAVGADPLMGDGAGILIQIPDLLFREEMAKQGVTLPPVGEYGVGMIFLPKENASRLACEQALERAIRVEGQILLGWRDVPINRDMPMSPIVREKEPIIRQVFIGRGADVMVTDALERKLYVIRKTASHAIQALNLKHCQEYFVPSMSARTIVYKGLLLANQVGEYYRDLADMRCVSALAMVHQRFSTNTFPEWPLAHPYRLVAHNGEINTVKGNFNWLRAREGVMQSAVLGNDLKKLFPTVYEGQSDTATFDNCLELLLMAGYPLAQAMMMLIPEAWENHETMDANRRAFYEYHASMMEPWDGPAAIAFTDGRQIGATLDRNGLRPARYIVTDDDLVILASESGVLPIAESKIIKKWRLQPGKMLLIDMVAGRIINDAELKNSLANAKPYREWIDRIQIKLDSLTPIEKSIDQNQLEDEKSTQDASYQQTLLQQQIAFGYTEETLKFVLKPMVTDAEEAVGSMGNDAALAILSHRAQPLYHYFRQLFAQVTNPPIDPIREKLVMSLVSFIGPKPNLLDVNNINPPIRLEVSQPILNANEIAKIRQIDLYTDHKFHAYEINICYPYQWGEEGIQGYLAALCADAVEAVKAGFNILIISDRKIDEAHIAIPALLALSAIHQQLIKKGLRTSTGLIVETGSAREVHHFALLAGFGAEAIYPYLAIQSVHALALQHQASPQQAEKNFIKAVGKGLQKVMSKMGISTYMSYCGAQIFEAIGLNQVFLDKYFTGTHSRLGGLGIFDIAKETFEMHQAAYHVAQPNKPCLSQAGEYAYRKEGEHHLWTPETISKLQLAVRSNQLQSYKEFAHLINDQTRRQLTLRGLFEFKTKRKTSILLEEVEPASEIVKRFATGAMSLGSISTEAHASLAVAMNRIGGKSNTGEGGEDAARYRHELAGNSLPENSTLASVLGKQHIEADIALQPGDSLKSKIKQVASGRFGVSAEYLISAEQIQIKMAQGAKPGEGGQLPGHKVSPYIAKLRFSVPGVGLISPPPHHDIYSIEDLAQLIHDLKNVNPSASISVKLVSEIGVGTIAAGVAKCKADHLVIAGHDGGTGAAPLSSIKHAGTPWELGLAETQQTLLLNKLRSRIRVQVDGQLRTGRDVVIAALLGADEFGFATAPLVTQGCIMMRKCHLNTCPVGIATQNPELRKKFSGQPEHVINYFFFIAEEVREIMAELGIKSFNQLIGRSDLLAKRSDIENWKINKMDLSPIFHRIDNGSPYYATETQDHQLSEALDQTLIARTEPALSRKERVSFIQTVSNTHRSVGAMLSGKIAQRFGHDGLPDDTIHIQFNGIAGQSFGAFLARGITFDLVGAGNDYVGKGLSGGRIIIRCANDFLGFAPEHIIVGNTVLYGALEGEAYFNGVAGERFAVRNSGALAVIEGVGDHACEYMTGGTVIILGETGRNFAAGMSGGIAYVYDPQAQLAQHSKQADAILKPILSSAEQLLQSPIETWHKPYLNSEPMSDEQILKQYIQAHFRYTGSLRAKAILEDWANARSAFIKVFPNEYRAALQAKQVINSTPELA